MSKKLKLKIVNMHCSSCAISIDFALEDIGVKSKTNYAKSETEVEFDEAKVSEKRLIEEIKKAGYQAVMI
ncbi:heavy-metal-associated domain-containing protein [Candidatus Gottesmanbacteria bacterium]|nr:heavy-metal-associated domain-containing protein [Candidatus Gottesmanbacteria bacterium]